MSSNPLTSLPDLFVHTPALTHLNVRSSSTETLTETQMGRDGGTETQRGVRATRTKGTASRGSERDREGEGAH